ncbi:DDE family transposase [Myroides indicus]|uniref:DDE family transposase n=1 Tax=Myroides indicus TaxID=1323422 RepID=A0A4R7EYQ1_9FLAO|nr:DDE family transposase [Myroides indicus]
MLLAAHKIHLKERVLIETVNDELKEMCQVEHTKHRPLNNFIANILAANCLLLLP